MYPRWAHPPPYLPARPSTVSAEIKNRPQDPLPACLIVVACPVCRAVPTPSSALSQRTLLVWTGAVRRPARARQVPHAATARAGVALTVAGPVLLVSQVRTLSVITNYREMGQGTAMRGRSMQ
jgi:hypothetical protein